MSRADDIAVVWGAYRGRHPTCRPAPPKALRAHIAGRLTDYTAEDVALVIAWAHESRHERAAYLQDHEYLGLDNILRAEKFPVRLELATAWEARGRRDVAVPTVVPFRREGRPTMMDLVREAEAREAAEKARPTRIILEAK